MGTKRAFNGQESAAKKSVGHWSQGLISSMEDPDLKVEEDDSTVVIKDKYPKAEIHLLILPKEDISHLGKLKKKHVSLLKSMFAYGNRIMEENPNREISGDVKEAQLSLKLLEESLNLKAVNLRNFFWAYSVHIICIKSMGEIASKFSSSYKQGLGFHAVASMSRLHMHVISQDFNSPSLKTKRHWNSFTTSYFVPASSIISELESNGCLKIISSKTAESLLATPLKCHKCSLEPKTMPQLKLHLLTHSKKEDEN